MNPRNLIISLYVILFAGLGVGAGALFLNTRAEYNHLREAEAAIKRRLAEKEEQLAKQEKILERLRKDPAFVEKTIRRQLGYTKAGETVYRFED